MSMRTLTKKCQLFSVLRNVIHSKGLLELKGILKFLPSHKLSKLVDGTLLAKLCEQQNTMRNALGYQMSVLLALYTACQYCHPVSSLNSFLAIWIIRLSTQDY